MSILELQGNHARAELVGQVYSLSWATAILMALLMWAVQIIFLRGVTDDDHRVMFELVAKLDAVRAADAAQLGKKNVPVRSFFMRPGRRMGLLQFVRR
jgi:hypothetical protein